MPADHIQVASCQPKPNR